MGALSISGRLGDSKGSSCIGRYSSLLGRSGVSAARGNAQMGNGKQIPWMDGVSLMKMVPNCDDLP
jgi:hypothetical protein